MSEPDDRLKPEIAVTGLLLYFDTNVIGHESDAVAALWRCRAEGWISIQRSDTMDTELAGAPDDRRDALLGESADLAESLGSLVLGHSRLGHTVLGSEVDAAELAAVFDLLHPGQTIGQGTRKQHIRDSMHVATALKYRADAFVTRDEGIQNKTQHCQSLFGLRLLSPDDALEQVKEAIEHVVSAQPVTGWPTWMPQWRPM